MQRLCAIGDVSSDIGLPRRKREFEDAAKAHMLSPEDAMAGMYALYGTEKSLALFSTLLLRPSAERIRIHNAYVATLHGAEFVSLHGEAILALQWPLFPATDAFSTLNRLLLNDAATASGGSARRPAVYAQANEARPAVPVNPAGGSPNAAVNPTGGAPWVRVIRGDDGEQYVDLADAFNAHMSLDARIAKVEGRPQNARRQQQHQQQQQQYQPRTNANRRDTRPRGKGPRGGEPEEKDFQQVERADRSTLK
jgi:hypothetical protein